jgi:hypothetical protein
MGWTDIPWYTICTERFSADFGVDEWFGLNIFLRDGDDVYRTYFLQHGGKPAVYPRVVVHAPLTGVRVFVDDDDDEAVDHVGGIWHDTRLVARGARLRDVHGPTALSLFTARSCPVTDIDADGPVRRFARENPAQYQSTAHSGEDPVRVSVLRRSEACRAGNDDERGEHNESAAHAAR